MTSATGHSTPLYTYRRAPAPGEIGHPGTCPLCSHAAAAPPCLACRDELRTRLAEFNAVEMTDLALN